MAFPADVNYYLDKELSHLAMLGPFRQPTFPQYHTSPIMSRPKKDSSHRRIIVDLSWPPGASVNDGIPKDTYLGDPVFFRLPTVDSMADRLRRLGRGAYMYKSDLARGYRELRVDPRDWPMLGIIHDGLYYFDICPPFGMRSSAMFMQRTTSAVTRFQARKGWEIDAYIDDFGGVELEFSDAGAGLTSLQDTFRDLGLEETGDKIVPPTQVMVWLGIEFNSNEMTMSIPPPPPPPPRRWQRSEG